jgi:adenosylmethionine-8-amino-7-oxononanoate aminotransferase
MALWYPYTQMKNLTPYPIVKKGKGALIYLEDGRKLIDGISSWWSALHGYNHPKLNQVISKQVKKFSHVMLGGLSHKPALELAEKLVEITPKGLNHVFFSDSGSVAVEVSLKMAIQYWSNKNEIEKTKIISLTHSYHGDTFKAMEISDDSDFIKGFSRILNKGFFIDSPDKGFDQIDVKKESAILEKILKENHQKIAALILEPIIQCAGGFKIYSPQFLVEVRNLCNQYNVLLIFDEVATGFGRTGKLFASEHAKITPDILILGKALTAGYIGHAATIANSKVYNSFLGNNYENAFMHGPTFMGNPLACSVALKSIEIFEKENYLAKIQRIESIIKSEFSKIKSPYVKEKKIIGAIGAIELIDKKHLIGFQEFAMKKNVWLRPIGNIVYLMPPFIIKKKELKKILEVIQIWISTIK